MPAAKVPRKPISRLLLHQLVAVSRAFITPMTAIVATEKIAAQAAYVEARKTATSAVVAARQAYRKAGGAD